MHIYNVIKEILRAICSVKHLLKLNNNDHFSEKLANFQSQLGQIYTKNKCL